MGAGQMTWQSWPVPPPDLDPSNEELEEDCDIGQHLELAMKFGGELGHIQTIVEH